MYDANDVVSLLDENGFEVSNVIEAREPDREILGETFRVDHLVVSAVHR